MKYIDAEKLIAEIERQIEEDKNNITEDTKPYYGARQQVRSKFLALLDSLQQEQPEVDIEEEIHEKALQLHTAPTYDELENFARHFYGLGLKARKV